MEVVIVMSNVGNNQRAGDLLGWQGICGKLHHFTRLVHSLVGRN
jgi:hypothetical protein